METNMKKMIIWAMAIMAIVACKKEVEVQESTLKVNPVAITFDYEGGEASFNITSNTAWSISSDAEFAVLSATSGQGDQTITVSVDQNDGEQARQAYLTIQTTDGEKSAQVLVNQDAEVIVTSMSFTYEAQEASVMISYAGNWGIALGVDAVQSWVDFSEYSGTGRTEIVVSVEENLGSSSRSVNAEIFDVDTNETVYTLKISQEMISIEGIDVRLSVSSMSVSATEVSKSITIAVFGTDEIPTISCDADYVTCGETEYDSEDPVYGDGMSFPQTHVLYGLPFEVEANPTEEDRSFELKVTCGEYSVNIPVTQEAAVIGEEIFDKSSAIRKVFSDITTTTNLDPEAVYTLYSSDGVSVTMQVDESVKWYVGSISSYNVVYFAKGSKLKFCVSCEEKSVDLKRVIFYSGESTNHGEND